jgi:MFS family permease
LWDTTFNDLNNIYGANLAGLAVGCILFIPFALKYGRRVVYLFSVTVTLASTIWMAQVNGLVPLVIANLISGLAGAVSEALVQMTVRRPNVCESAAANH